MSANAGFAASLLRCVRLASHAVCSSCFAGGVLVTLRTIIMAAAKKCSIPECESVVDIRGSARCKSCNAARSKVQHKIKGLGGEAFGSWQAKDPNEKADMYAEAKDLYGDALAFYLKNKLTKESIEENFVALGGNGIWIDEEDLELKYKTKPKRLLAIKKMHNNGMTPSRRPRCSKIWSLYQNIATHTQSGQLRRGCLHKQ